MRASIAAVCLFLLASACGGEDAAERHGFSFEGEIVEVRLGEDRPAHVPPVTAGTAADPAPGGQHAVEVPEPGFIDVIPEDDPPEAFAACASHSGGAYAIFFDEQTSFPPALIEADDFAEALAGRIVTVDGTVYRPAAGDEEGCGILAQAVTADVDRTPRPEPAGPPGDPEGRQFREPAESPGARDPVGPAPGGQQDPGGGPAQP